MSAPTPVETPAADENVIECASLTFDEALAFTGYGENHLRALVNADLIPHKHVGAKGGKVTFHKRALDDWMYADAMSHVRKDDQR